MRKSILLVVVVAGLAVSAFAGNTFYNIEDLSGWSSCGACAGINAFPGPK